MYQLLSQQQGLFNKTAGADVFGSRRTSGHVHQVQELRAQLDQRRPQGIEAPPKGMDSVPGRRARGKAAHGFPINFAAHYQSLKEQTLKGSVDAPTKHP